MGSLHCRLGSTPGLTGTDRISQICCRVDVATRYALLYSPPLKDSHAALLGVVLVIQDKPTISLPRWAGLKRMRKRHRSRWPRSPQRSRRSCGSGQGARHGRRRSPWLARWTEARRPRHRQCHPRWCEPRSSGAGRTAESAGGTRRRSGGSWPRSRWGATGWG